MTADKGVNPTLKRMAFISTGAPEAEAARIRLIHTYGNADPGSADVIVALGGDGLMLQTLHRFMGSGKPLYGMNRGSVGFLMNEYREEDLLVRLARARPVVLHPLRMSAQCIDGASINALAVNEVSLLRETRQTAKLRISIDGIVRLEELI